MTDTIYRPTEDVREHARTSALAGRPIFANPHVGSDAEVWFSAYRNVPETERGSQPELMTSFRTIHARAEKKASSGWQSPACRAKLAALVQAFDVLKASDAEARPSRRGFRRIQAIKAATR